jgi:hypothetical protein
MTAQHLKGRIFHREGVNYLVMDDNDWKADILNVRSINAKRRVYHVPKAEIIRCLGDAIACAS